MPPTTSSTVLEMVPVPKVHSVFIYFQKSKDWNSNHIKVFGSRKTKGPQQETSVYTLNVWSS